MIKKLFYLIFIVVILFFVSHLEYQGKPIRQYFQEFYQKQEIQQTVRRVKLFIRAYLEKDVGDHQSGQSKQSGKSGESNYVDRLTEQDRQELERLLKQELHKARQ